MEAAFAAPDVALTASPPNALQASQGARRGKTIRFRDGRGAASTPSNIQVVTMVAGEFRFAGEKSLLGS